MGGSHENTDALYKEPESCVHEHLILVLLHLFEEQAHFSSMLIY